MNPRTKSECKMRCKLSGTRKRGDCQPFPDLIMTPCQVWRRWTYCRIIVFLLLIHYFTLWPWPLTSDLEHLQHIACDVMKLCTKFERNRTICGWVIAISVFDLMTLNIALRVALGSEIIFTKFDLRQLIRAAIIAFLMLIRSVTLWPWPLTRWPWKFVVHEESRNQSLCEIWAKWSNYW